MLSKIVLLYRRLYLETPLRQETEHSPMTDFDPDHTFDETTIE